VGQGEHLRRHDGRRPGQDPIRARPRQHRSDGQAQLVQQVGRGDMGQQMRAALGEHPAMAALGQRGDGRFQVNPLLAGHDDLGGPVQGGAPVGRGLRGGDDDRAGRRRGRRDEAAGRVEVKPRGDHRDRRGGGATRPQVRPELVLAHRRVALGADRGRPHHDHVGEGTEQCEQVPIGL
jgi:hypothetical protein